MPDRRKILRGIGHRLLNGMAKRMHLLTAPKTKLMISAPVLNPMAALEARLETLKQVEIVQSFQLHQNDHMASGGTWSCSMCKAENHVSILPGAYPLGFLRCTECRHVWCQQCSTPEVMSFILPPPTLEGTVYLSVTPGSKEVPLAYLCGACGLTLRPKMGAGENGMAGSLTYPSEHCICGAKTGSENAKWTLLALPGTDTQKMEKLEPEVEETPNRAPHLSVDLGNSLTENIFAETGFSMLHVNWNLDDVRRTGIFSAP